MSNLSKQEMLEALAEAMILNADGGCSEYMECAGYDDDEIPTIDDLICELDGEPSYALEYCSFSKDSENYIVQKENSRGAEGDGADMFTTFKITRKSDNAVGHLEFCGRYSSWDSSEFYECYAVTPVEVTVVQYKRV